MKDETYVFISDVKDKKITARSARHQRTHNGKGGRVRLPSDNLSKKELMKMNGECKSYRLNDPMTREEFQAMPTDLKITYIKAIRNKYGIPDSHLGKALGYNQQNFSKVIKKLGIANGQGSGKKKWDKEGFYTWWYGVEKLPTPTHEEKEAIFFGEEKGHVEEDLPFDIVPIEEPEACAEEDFPFAEKVLTGIHPSQAELEAKAKAELEWLRTECDSLRMNVRILEAQMEIVRLIFGGRK